MIRIAVGRDSARGWAGAPRRRPHLVGILVALVAGFASSCLMGFGPVDRGADSAWATTSRSSSPGGVARTGPSPARSRPDAAYRAMTAPEVAEFCAKVKAVPSFGAVEETADGRRIGGYGEWTAALRSKRGVYIVVGRPGTSLYSWDGTGSALRPVPAGFGTKPTTALVSVSTGNGGLPLQCLASMDLSGPATTGSFTSAGSALGEESKVRGHPYLGDCSRWSSSRPAEPESWCSGIQLNEPTRKTFMLGYPNSDVGVLVTVERREAGWKITDVSNPPFGSRPTFPRDPRSYAVTTDLTIRTGPGTSNRPLGSIPTGTVVPVQCVFGGEVVNGPRGPDDQWLRVTFNGLTGWVSDQFVDTRDDVGDRSVIPECPTTMVGAM